MKEYDENNQYNDTNLIEETKPGWRYMKYLGDPELFNIITETEFDKKIVGEIPSRKVIFLCSCGRLVENCQVASFNLLVNDDAGVGKDYVCRNVLRILPKDVYIHKTRISPTVFTYWKPVDDWDGIVFYPEDISENVLNSEVFKVMCSEGSDATVVIKQKAVDIEIIGKPVMITTTATAVPNPELTRRFTILNLDSSEDQTKLIMKRHSEYKEKGIVPVYNPIIKESLGKLKRVKVKIPFATLINDYFPSKNVIMRTHYPRFLDFISASAALHQYQRKFDEMNFLLAKGEDYDIARECFMKLCSNKYMIPLTINQKKIMAYFEKNEDTCGSVTQLHPEMNFLSIPALQTNLGLLAKYGLLQSRKEILGYREIEIYSINKEYGTKDILLLPTFKQICEKSVIESVVTNKNEKNEEKENGGTV